MTRETYTARVCVDCYFVHHYGFEADNISAEGVIRETGLVALSDLGDAHAFDATDSETGEGIDDFSSSSCDGCGTHLAGARYELAVELPELSDAAVDQIIADVTADDWFNEGSHFDYD